MPACLVRFWQCALSALSPIRLLISVVPSLCSRAQKSWLQVAMWALRIDGVAGLR